MSLCMDLLQFLSITKKKNQHFFIKLIRKRVNIRVNIKILYPCFHDNIIVNALI